MLQTDSSQRFSFLLLFFILLVTFFLLNSGITPNFILDDTPNLKGLAEIQQESSLSSFLNYVFNNEVISGRRILSYLTFALQADSWPLATAFKQFNIYLHLVNGILIYWLSYNLFSMKLSSQLRAKNIYIPALLTTIIWLLSPIQVSTVLYVVQRMAMLSTFYVLIGLISYSYALKLDKKAVKQQFYLMICFAISLILAVLSKEDGILLSLYAFLVYTTVKPAHGESRVLKLWRYGLLLLPLLILFSYLLILFPERSFNYSHRYFSMIERTLTELRILSDYLKMIVLPSSTDYTLFYTNYPLSSSLFKPLSTLFSLVFLSGLIIFAWLKKQSYPIVSLGILLFFAAHLLESTVLPLELYFEHRNYFALLGVALVAGSLLASLSQLQQHKKIIPAVKTGIVFWLLLTIFITWSQTQLWSKPLEQSYFWYQKNPTGHRSHGNYAKELVRNRQYETAAQLYQNSIHLFPEDPTKVLLWWELQCYYPIKTLPTHEKLLTMAKTGRYYNETSAIFISILEKRESGFCTDIDDLFLMKLMEVFVQKSKYSQQKQSLLILMARLSQLHRDTEMTIHFLEEALKVNTYNLDVLTAIIEKYLMIKNKEKSEQFLKQLNEQCSHFSLKCLNYKKDIGILNNKFNEIFIENKG